MGPHRSRVKSAFWACLLLFFLYLVLVGCTEPRALLTPTELTAVPNVHDLQASVGLTSIGNRRVLLTWKYDSTNANLRSWDIQRAVNDSAVETLGYLDLVRRPTSGYPFYSDTSGRLQQFDTDSIEVYYRIVPNGDVNNFIGEPSVPIHVLVRH